MSAPACDVVVVGAGPAGLAAAVELRRLGVERIVVVEREAQGGGVPRHCGHPPFGLREFGRILTGPAYARRLVRMARDHGVEVSLSTTVTGFRPWEDGIDVSISTPKGVKWLSARRVLLATGTRETPRSARLVTGERPLGVINTGALQAYAYVEHLAPFRRPVIVGTELVSLSAILTCRSLGAYPVAMIEEASETIAPRPYFLYPRLSGLPVLTGTRIIDIAGSPRVTHVVTEDKRGGQRTIVCDGVIFTGKFVPEAHLARLAGLTLDRATGGPIIDQFGRTSDPRFFAAGNLLRPVETAGWSFREGRTVAAAMARDFEGRLPSAPAPAIIHPGPGLRYAVPQRLSAGGEGFADLQLRVEQPFTGKLVARAADGSILLERRLSTRPERRITLPIAALAGAAGTIILELAGAGP